LCDLERCQTETKTKYSDSLILQELSHTCSSKELKTKYRLCQLLKYLISETLAGKSGQLIGYTIGLEVFNRGKDFNPELDPIVRIQVGRLRRALDKYYSTEGKNDSIRFSIPLGKYSPLFIPNLESDFKMSDEFEETGLNSSAKPSILVLPFINLTGEEQQEFFVRRITEELSIELTRYEDFRVIGFRIKENLAPNVSENEKFLKDLDAHFIIRGSVRKENRQVKVSIKLIDVFTSEQLWAEQFRRELNPTDLISIQEEIARETVTIIANEYGIIPQRISKESRKKAPKDLDTYEAILRYYHYQIYHTQETAVAAFTALEQAVVNDPDSGVALAMLASLYCTRYELDLPESTNALAKTIELTNRAIELEPDSQPVRIAYAWSQFVQENRDLFLIEIEKALALNPNSPFRIGMIGFFLSLYSEWEKGKEFLDKAMNQNLGFPHWYYGATTLYHYRLNEFEKAYEEALKYDVPAIFWGPMLRATTLGQLDRQSEAKQHISDLKTLKPDFESKARYLISRYVKEEELVEKIIEGLQKAGLSF
jgi:adenylate cyclase